MRRKSHEHLMKFMAFVYSLKSASPSGGADFSLALFQFKCSVVELIVSALLGNQLLVIASFDNASVFHNHYYIGISHG